MTKKQIGTLVKNSSKYVSDKLNNTPSISKKSYINPAILNKVLVNPSRFTIPFQMIRKIFIFIYKS